MSLSKCRTAVISRSTSRSICRSRFARRSDCLASRFWLASTNSATKIASSDVVIVRNGNGNGSNGATMGSHPVLMAIQAENQIRCATSDTLLAAADVILSLRRSILVRLSSAARSHDLIALTFSSTARMAPVCVASSGIIQRVSMHRACHAFQLFNRFLQRRPLAQHVGPQVARLLDARGHVAHGEGRRRHLAFLDLLPGAWRRYGRAALRANGVRRGERRAVAVAAGIHVDAPFAIDLVEFLRQVLGC